MTDGGWNKEPPAIAVALVRIMSLQMRLLRLEAAQRMKQLEAMSKMLAEKE